MRLVHVCLLLWLAVACSAQPSRPAAKAPTPQPQRAEGQLTPASFSARGLHHEKDLTNLFQGEFVNIPFDRENIAFDIFFQQYLESYARHCSAYLPANKVEMTQQVCAQEQYQVDRYGNRVGGSTCIAYRTVGTGLFADPALYDVKNRLDAQTAPDVLKEGLKMMTQKNPLQAALNTAGEARDITQDMDGLFQLNPCPSAGVKRFQENLTLFALGKPGLRLPGAAVAPSIAQPTPGAAFKDQNYTRLLEDLISDQSRSWLMNRYVSGSTTNVTVSSRDAAGRPAKVVGQYLFNGRSRGSVTVEFSDGLPECMYFFDLPSSCRTPNRRIVAAYSSGSYQQ
jgi:hypothetical protein